MQTNMSDKITVIVAESPNVWRRQVIDPGKWISAFNIQSLLSVKIAGDTTIFDFINDNDIETKLDAFADHITDMAAELIQIQIRRDINSPDALFSVVIRLSEINEALQGIDDIVEQIDNKDEESTKDFQEKTPALKTSTAQPYSSEEEKRITEEAPPSFRPGRPQPASGSRSARPGEVYWEDPASRRQSDKEKKEKQQEFINEFKANWLAESASLNSEQAKERALAINALVDIVSTTAQTVRVYIETLKDNKQRGNIHGYLSALKQLAVEQQEFENQFKNIYSNYLEPLASTDTDYYWDERSRQISEPAPDTERDPHSPEISTTPEKEVPVAGIGELEPEDMDIVEFPSTERTPQTQRTPQWEHSSQVSKQKPGESKMKWEETVPATEETPQQIELRRAMLKVQHVRFVEELKKAASHNDPYLLAAMLAKYSGQIEESDPEASLKLIAITEGVIEN
jgi:hypothetical protein